MVGFSSYRVVGVVGVIVHTVGSVMALHLYNKKHKLIDMLPILLIYTNANEYACLAIVITKLILSYFIAPDTLIKPLRIRVELALLLVVIFSYFAADTLTNYISFILLLSIFSLT
jgi:hypothetical protein